MKIYTKKGDKGFTTLLSGKKVLKDNLFIEAYGTIDELNSFIGLLATKTQENKIICQLKKIQSNLFTIGAYLTCEEEYDKKNLPPLNTEIITELENWIDEMETQLVPLKNFILPGGSEPASLSHIARTICRRAERTIIQCLFLFPVKEVILPYINRLSDYFFVLSRYLNKLNNVNEEIWNPHTTKL